VKHRLPCCNALAAEPPSQDPAKSSPPPPASPNRCRTQPARAHLGPPEPIWGRGVQQGQADAGSLRSSLAVGTAPPPASPSRAGPWSPYEHRRQGGEGPDPPSQTRGMESHRRRRRPGFARRPLPAAAMGEGARRGGGRRWVREPPSPLGGREGTMGFFPVRSGSKMTILELLMSELLTSHYRSISSSPLRLRLRLHASTTLLLSDR
jgi:hypothetical protein